MESVLFLMMFVGFLVFCLDLVNGIVNWLCEVFPSLEKRLYADIPEYNDERD
jgi:hypothetical protein